MTPRALGKINDSTVKKDNETSMPPSPKHSRRRWFPLGHGTMLLFVALVAVLAFALREHWERRILEAISAQQVLNTANVKATAESRELHEACLAILNAPPSPVRSFYDDIFPAALDVHEQQ